jgi:tetratricopeptide (TPR) repeat protein
MAGEKRVARRAPRKGAGREPEGKESLQLDREAVRHWRVQAGFTQEALSRQSVEIDGERVQISYAQLRRIEAAGRAGPGTARILAALLGVELAQLRPRDARALPCGLPREVSVDFVGRRAELAAVLEVLQREGNVRIAASVEGLPGVGKTELALQVCGVCERSRAFRIVWLNAEQPDLTAQWAGPVAQHFGIEHPEERERARLALRKLESLGEPTLIVLDNLERWSASEPWPRPQGRHLRWLVTTRVSQLGDRAFEHVEVPVLDEPTARELFARIAGLEVCERPGFAELIRHLDGYTIAIELAAAFLGRFPEVDPAEYLKLLTAGKADLLEDEVRERTPYQQTLETALDVLWRRIPASTRDLWILAACFAQESVGPEFSEACGLNRRACARLRDFHLIQRDLRGWTMHRRVRAFALRSAHAGDLERFRARFVEGSAACLAPAGSEASILLYSRERSHIDRALELADSILTSSEEVLAGLSLGVGCARSRLGTLSSAHALLERAAQYYGERARCSDRVRDPLAYARAHEKLARALLAKAVWDYGPGSMHALVLAGAEAAAAFDRAALPVEWADAQRIYGRSLHLRADRDGGEFGDYEQALQAYDAALTVFTRSDAPIEWARTECWRGLALGQFGVSRGLNERILEGASVCRAACEVLSKDASPLEWAGSQANAAHFLNCLSENTGQPEFSEQAASACRAALEVRRRDEMPVLWAKSQFALAWALFWCAEDAPPGIELLEASIQAFRDAAELLQNQGPFVLLTVQEGLVQALRALGLRLDSKDLCEQAVACARSTLEGHRSAPHGTYWIYPQCELGLTLALVGEKSGNLAEVREGIELCRTAYALLGASAFDPSTGLARSYLGESLFALGRCTGEVQHFRESLEQFRATYPSIQRRPRQARQVRAYIEEIEAMNACRDERR